MNTIDSLAFIFSLKIGRQCTPPPPGMKKLDTGQSDIFVLADVPPQGKSWTQVKVTFWFWLMYPPPQK